MKHLKIVIALSVTVVFFSLAVFLMNEWSAPIIQANKDAKADAAKYEVLPTLNSETDQAFLNAWYAPSCPEELPEGKSCDSDTFDFGDYPIVKVNEIPNKGYIYEVTYAGYAGDVTYLVALDTEGLVTGFSVVSQTETKDVGGKITQDGVKNAFPGSTLEEAAAFDYDSLAGATAAVTWGGLKASLLDVKEFHAVAFEGVVLETPEERLARLKAEITSVDATFEDVTETYSLPNFSYENGAITKIEMVNTDEAVLYTVIFSNDMYSDGDNEIIVAVDYDTEELLGLRVIEAVDSPGYGAELAQEAYDDQFTGMTFDTVFAGGIDAIAGTSGAPITTGNLKESLKAMLDFHKEEVLGEVAETPEERLVRLKEEITTVGATFTDITSSQDFSSYTVTDSSIVMVEEVNGGEAYIYSFVFTTEYSGGVNNEIIMAVDGDTETILGLRVIRATDSGGFGGELANPDYDDQFVDMTFTEATDGDIDAIAGASGAPTTTGKFKEAVKGVIEYHQSIGGGN